MNNEFDFNDQPLGGQEPTIPVTDAGENNPYIRREDTSATKLRFGPSEGTSQSYQPQSVPVEPVQPATPAQPVTPVEPRPTMASQAASAESRTTDGAYHYYYGVRNEQPTGGYEAPRSYKEPYYQTAPSYGIPDPPKPVEPVKKKKSGKGAAIAAAIICLVLGLGIGCGAMAIISGAGDKAQGETTAPEETVTDSKLEQSTLEIGGQEETPVKDENPAFNSTTIEITTNSETTAMTPQNVYEHYVNAVVAIANEGTATNIFGQVSATASTGSGMIISQDGYVLTNNHVVEDAEKLTVTMTSGEEYEATLVGADPDNDVALIKIEGEGFPTVSIGDSDTIQVGEQLCAIGNPLGELTNTLTVGYVSALDREINEDGIPINMFQTDCAINSGNSGGPIFDMNGNVVGITTAKYSASALSGSASIEGIGFCIPINDAMDIVNDLLQYGYVRGRVSMGIMCQAISSTVTQYYNLPAGIYVSTVEPGSAADKAGLKEGDIICAIEGVEVTSVTELKVKLKEYKPGDSATLTVYDNESHETKDVSITFDEMVTSATEQQEAAQEEAQQPQQEIPEGTQIYPFFPFG